MSNVVKAHLLAADKLLDPPLLIESVAASNLETISLTTGKYTIPSSGSGPPGPALEITPEIDKSYFNFKEGPQSRASVRSKFVPLGAENIELEPSYPLQVTGRAFFITNREPMCFWDFAQAACAEMGHKRPSWKINISMGMGTILC